MIQAEHRRLMHAGPTLLMSSPCQQYCSIVLHKAVRSITHQCVNCKRQSLRPQQQIIRRLPSERVTPAPVFKRFGVDYAGPFQIKYGHIRKPLVFKRIFVCLAVKAVHLVVVSDLTTEAFIVALLHFIARCGEPTLIWSGHGTNFVGAKRELREKKHFFSNHSVQRVISEFCHDQNIEWKHFPERSPPFGGL